MFTIIPIPQLNISIGSSTIYSDIDVQVAYLVPFLFFRSADYGLSNMSDNASSNSQFFFDISSRNIRHLHLFFTFFVDELSVYRIGNSERHNFFSYKGGFRLSNWPVDNISLISEYTFTLPMVYQHYISTTTFESDSYSLGHYMRDNSHDLYMALVYKPLCGLRLELSYNFAQHGNNYVYGEYKPGDGAPILKDITWQKNIVGLKARYAFLSNATVFAGIYFSNIQGYDVDGLPPEYYLSLFTPEMYWNNTTSLWLGFRVGL
ncbi:MAG: hypothetical protein HQ565_01425 [Bacteroidetes bacterium]|nr:hypothetical protein [Bacteroidota bacterium]